MVPNWLYACSLGIGLALCGSGCLSHKGSRVTVTLGPEGASAPVQELPAKDSAYLCQVTAQEFERASRVPEAISLYEKARVLDPKMEKKITRRLAVLYDQIGDFAKADEEYAKVLASQPKDADLLNDMGYSYYSRGDWKSAEEHLTQAVEINPQHKRAWINLGMTIAQQERYPESMRAFRRAVPEGEALCNLGFVLAVQGKKEKAQEAYSRAAELQPGLRLAQAAVNRYSNPEPIKPEMPVSKVKGVQPLQALPTMPISTPQEPAPSPKRIPDELTSPVIVDPDFDSLPGRPKITQP